MSHFAVTIIGKDYKSILAPFQENNMGDCPRLFMEFNDMEEECRESYNEDNQGYGSFNEYIQNYYGYKKDPELGVYGYWENPNAKWDWYQIGGRYSGKLRLKDGNYTNQAVKKDIDFEGIKTDHVNDFLNFYDEFEKNIGFVKGEEFLDFDKIKEEHDDITIACNIYENQPIFKRISNFRENNKNHPFRNEVIFLDGDEVKLLLTGRDNYAETMANIAMTTFAIARKAPKNLLSNEKNDNEIIYHGSHWCERGSMGWWGVVSNETEKKVWEQIYWEIMDSVKKNDLITIVDCHI